MWCPPALPRMRLKTFSPAEQEVGLGVLAKFLSIPAVNPSQSALRKFVKECAFRVEDGAWLKRWSDSRVVRVDHVTSGRRCPFRRTASCELLIALSRGESLPSGCSPFISCSGEPWGMVGVEVAEHHLVSTVLQKGVEVGGHSSEGRRTQAVCMHWWRSMWFPVESYLKFLLLLSKLSFWHDCYRRWQGKETQLRSQSFILGDTIQ